MEIRLWRSCRPLEKLLLLLCGALLVFCAGSEWGRQQRSLPPLFHAAPVAAAASP